MEEPDRQRRGKDTRFAANVDVTGQEPRTESKGSGLIQ